MAHYHLGDTPADETVLTIDADIDLTGYTPDAVTLVDPDGNIVTATLTAEIDAVDGCVYVAWPTASPWPTLAGTYWLNVRIKKGTRKLTLPELPIVIIGPRDGWHNIETARIGWPDATAVDDYVLSELLDIAKHDVLEYAPVLEEDDMIPPSYRRAQQMQARNRLNAGSVDPSTGEDGGTSYSLQPFPLDWHIKQLLRPKRPGRWVV